MATLLNAARIMAGMKLNQWKSSDELREIQERLLLRTVSYASASVPFYRRALKGARVRSLDDLASLPLTAKDSIRADARSFISDACAREKLTEKVTSGSTGMPVRLVMGQHDGDYSLALEYHHLTEAGVGPLDLQAHVTYFRLRPHLLQRLGFFRRIYLHNHDDERKNLESLKRMRPSVVHCYPSFLVLLAHANDAHRIGFRTRTVFSSAETLSAGARARITSSFGCDLRDLYGATETGWVAWQCEKGSMHVNSDSFVAEVVDSHAQPLPDGREGSLVITPLWKRAMPFIRYALGDRAILGGRCACGRGLQVIKSICGREDDLIVMPSGRVRSARLVDVSLRTIPEILLYRVEQDEAGGFLVKAVLSGKLTAPLRERIVASLVANFGERPRIEVERVDSLPRGPTGKIRAVVSRAYAKTGMAKGL